MIERINVIGVPISDINMEKTLKEVGQNLDLAKQSYICVSNVHTTVMAYDDPFYKEIQEKSFLTLPDGKPLSIIAKNEGAKQIEQVRGVDLMTALFKECNENCYRHFFYGGTSRNLEKLIANLQSSYNNLQIVGFEPSVFRELNQTEVADLAQRVRSTNADFLWIGIGAPHQEILCFKIRGLSGAVPIGVGGAFNVLANIVSDAPKWMQKCSLEWLYRLGREPQRLFKRYLVTNSKFLWCIVAQKWVKR